MKKTAIAILVTLGLGSAAYAYGGGHGGMGFNGPCGKHHKNETMKIVKQLDLSSDQKAALKKIRMEQRSLKKENKQAMRKGMRKNMKQHKGMMQTDLSAFMSADHFDKNAFKAQMEKKFEARRSMMEEKRAKMLEMRTAKMEKIFNILTPEQRLKWIELSQKN